MNDLGFILFKKGQNKDAIYILKYNLAENPNSADAYENMAEGYETAGEKELAIQNFKKALELNPKNTYAADRIKKLSTPPSSQ